MSSAPERSRLALRVALAALLLASTRDARGYHDREERWTPLTAYVVRPREAQLGIFAWDVGAMRGVQLGTDTLPWAAGLFLPVMAPNAHVVVNPFPDSASSVALRGALYYARVRSGEDTRLNVFIVPVSLLASHAVTPALSLHLEGQYTWVDAKAGVRVSDTPLSGSGVSSAVQVGAMGMYRVGRVVALYARGRYQPWQRDVPFTARSQPDAYTTAEAEGNVRLTYAHHAWQALFGVALSWANVNLQLGAGYGDLFLPAFGVVVPYRGVLPDANLFVRF